MTVRDIIGIRELVPEKQFRNSASDIAPFFNPQSIAVLGTMKESAYFGGYVVVKQLLSFGYQGNIYPVNPSCSEVLGLTAYRSIEEVPEAIDLVIIITPAHVVPSIMEKCAGKNVRAAIIVADGFAEVGKNGAKLQQEVVKTAKEAHMRILGPNTIGTVNTAVGLITTPYLVPYEQIRKGGIALVSQTGIMGPQAIPFLDFRYGISSICDFGNKCDVNEIDLLQYLADDPQTRVIAMHIEDVKDGPRFLEVAKEVILKKPVVILKPGRTKASARAIASHTGSLAGDDQIYDTAFKQAHIIRAHTFQELLDIARILSYQPLPRGNKVAIATITGAGGIMAIDAAVEAGLIPSKLSNETLQRLTEISPVLASNPCDLGPVMPILLRTMDRLTFYEMIFEAILSDKNTDCAVITIVPPRDALERCAEMLAKLQKNSSKPVAIWVYGPTLSSIEELSCRLEEFEIPAYSGVENAAKALGALFQYSIARQGAGR